MSVNSSMNPELVSMPMPDLSSFPKGFRALVIGASGGIGQAMVQHLTAEPRCAAVVGLHRHSEPRIDFDDEASIASAAEVLLAGGRFHLIINAAGLLHSGSFMPEKKLGDLSYAQLEATFRTNTFGPGLVLRHFTPLLDIQRGVLALLSAKVGSIGDNTAAIEVKRSNPQAVLASLHPGTVNTGLSKPFKGEQIGRSASDAACDMLNVLAQLTPADTGSFFSYNGERLPW